jgi:hypothetical protein
MSTSPVAVPEPPKQLEKKPVKFSNLLRECLTVGLGVQSVANGLSVQSVLV